MKTNGKLPEFRTKLEQSVDMLIMLATHFDAVKNHLNFCMMATAVTWLYAIKLSNTPERRHMLRGRNSFVFSDVRYILAKTALSKDFDIVCPKQSKPRKNLSVAMLLRMIA